MSVRAKITLDFTRISDLREAQRYIDSMLAFLDADAEVDVSLRQMPEDGMP